MKYLLINKKTHNENYREALLSLEKFLSDGFNEIEVSNDDFNYEEFMKKLEEKDEVIICGGDGTLNYFINHIDLDNIKNNIYLYPAGTGNDFLNDLNKKDTKEPILINEYLKNLPTVIINDELKMKFINGVGYGIDGYCCEVADNLRDKINKPVNYSSIAIKGLLFHFKKRIANIKIDDNNYQFKNVWLVPTMKGRFYGGGMMIAPNQDRLKDEDLSVVVYKTKSKLKALMVFPSIFKGEHIKKKKVVKIFKGKNIEVSFNIPCALQVDGETILNVKKYKVVL
ncbi:MAG: polysaccharide pyruvyl transferase family protein [Acholeplasmatales bacterium]|nr:polysaccharide pyruvyl transferase family protein [Acholeplasmatales bacterium]